MKLIDKDAVVEEIERILDNAKELNYSCYILFCNHLKSFLSTLDGKEVDLEKETENWWKERLRLNPENQLWMDAHQSIVFAKHFFELGLKAAQEGGNQ